MRKIYVIFGVVFVAILFITCVLAPAMPEDPKLAKKLDMLADEYGDFIFLTKNLS